MNNNFMCGVYESRSTIIHKINVYVAVTIGIDCQSAEVTIAFLAYIAAALFTIHVT